LDSNHDGGGDVGLGAVSAFGFGEGFKDFEVSFDLFIFRYGLLIDAMEPIVDCEDLIEDGSVGGHERVGDFEAATEPVL
jgi:hypothetical protein